MLGRLRYIVLLALLALVLGTIVLAVYQRQEMQRFIEEGKSHNVAIARIFAHAVLRRYGHYLDTVASAEEGTIKPDDQTAEMAEWVGSLKQGTPVLSVRIYNRNGITVFSSEDLQIGKAAPHFDYFNAARSGHIITRLNLRDGRTRPLLTGEDRVVMETHLPVRARDRRIAAVFEMHIDATQLFEQANRDSGCIACGMYLTACRSIQNLMPTRNFCGIL